MTSVNTQLNCLKQETVILLAMLVLVSNIYV